MLLGLKATMGEALWQIRHKASYVVVSVVPRLPVIKLHSRESAVRHGLHKTKQTVRLPI
jgi:hypothetical protein